IRWCGAPGEARHGKIETAPEEVYGAGFAGEAGAEFLEHSIDLQQHAPEALRINRIIGFVNRVAAEIDRVRNLTGEGVDLQPYAELAQHRHGSFVELGDGHRFQHELRRLAVAGGEGQAMLDEVEADLEHTLAVRNRRRGETARIHIKRHMPGMIEP